MKSERGRPRSFDTDIALDSALKVFWKHGFQSASLSELTKATGLSKPSLYSAFGDKRSLYLKALERYLGLLVELHAARLTEEPDGRLAIESFLRSLTKMLTNPSLPGGCFIINGTADFDGPSVPKEVETALSQALKGTENLVNQRILQAQSDGQLPANIDPQDFCILLSTLIAGLAMKAKSGETEANLNLGITATMRAWPS
jgi:AcrR family transcriptional regulator